MTARWRYLIERNPASLPPFHLTQVDAEGTPLGPVGLGDFDTVPDAKLAAEELAPDDVRWKDPPRAWLPDAVYVSQFFEDDESGLAP